MPCVRTEAVVVQLDPTVTCLSCKAVCLVVNGLEDLLWGGEMGSVL